METRRMCPNCRAFITTSDRTCPYCNVTLAASPAQRHRANRDLLGGFIPHARFTTVLILIINFALFLATVVYSMNSGNQDAFMSLDGRTLFLFGAQNPSAILRYGQWWRLVTAGFLHGGLFHILMNMWVLFDLGAQVEEVYGSERLIVIYFIATVFGFLASAFWGAFLSVGASAGLFGLIGAMIAAASRHLGPMGASLRRLYIRWAVFGLLLGLLPGLQVDNAAHVGGLISGFCAGWVAGTPRFASMRAERFWQMLSYVCILLTGYSFLRMYLAFASNAR